MKKENKTEIILFRVTKTQRKMLEKLAVKYKCNLTDLILSALLERYSLTL